MQIVTDSGTDISFTPLEMKEHNVHVVPLTVTLGGKSYREGIDIKPDEFYDLLDAAEGMPVTSQPAAGEFALVYRELAKKDPDILSIHISSGLSGTVNSALAGAAMVPEARVTVIDTKTLSVPAGWQVEAAARALKAGWEPQRVLDMMKKVGDDTHVLYTLKELKYLIHGGRISHLKGLLASVLNIKPIIGVEKERGTYVTLGQARSFANAVKAAVEQITRRVETAVPLRAQVVHASNPEGAQQLMEEVAARFKVDWVPVRQLSLVLGAHVGRSMIGVCYAPAEEFAGLPD
ncbi:MAG TPA: DegV family protein [Anaerolineaceae bacterium]|nr:DegV family protein [Anaerolineaceae bacterium]